MSAWMDFSAFGHWFSYGETGISSQAIASHLSGHTGSDRGDYPRDPADFRRCQKLLMAVPAARKHLPEMASRSPEWARLVAAWDEIHEAIESDAPGYLEGRGRSAPLAYKLMRRIIDGGAPCADCDGTGNAESCPKCHGSGRRSGGRCRNRGCWHGHFQCQSCRGTGYIVPLPDRRQP